MINIHISSQFFSVCRLEIWQDDGLNLQKWSDRYPPHRYTQRRIQRGGGKGFSAQVSPCTKIKEKKQERKKGKEKVNERLKW